MSFNPNEYLFSQEHISLIGGTQSGKTNHLIYLLRAKSAQRNKVMMITAKPETKYRSAFDVITSDPDKALESFLVQEKDDNGKVLPPKLVLLEVDITDGDSVAELVNATTHYLQTNSNEGRQVNLTLAIDEYSLLVRHKLEGSEVNTSINRASATWRAYGGQLITVAQRSSMISHTVLTQSGFITMYRVPKGDIKSLDGIAYPDLESENVLNYLDENPYSFVVVRGFDLRRYDPIELQEAQ